MKVCRYEACKAGRSNLPTMGASHKTGDCFAAKAQERRLATTCHKQEIASTDERRLAMT